MSTAATEYYGYLLSQGYGEDQLKDFANYAQRANRGEISMNQSYKLAKQRGFKGGFSNTEGDDEDSGKKSWMQTAQESGWIDSGLAILVGLANKNKNQQPSYTPPPPPPQNNTMLYVIGGITVIGVGLAIFFAVRKNKINSNGQ